MKTRQTASGAGNWRGFFQMLGQIQLPWVMMLVAFVVEMTYNSALLALPTTTASLMSGSLEDSALRDAVLYYIAYGVIVTIDMGLLGFTARVAVRNARTKIWGKMTRVQMSYYDAHTANALTSAVTNDLEESVRLLVNLMITVLPSFYYLGAAVLNISQYDPLLVVSVLLPLPLQYIYMVIIGRWNYRTQAKIYQRIGTLTGYLAERVKNLPLIKQFCTEKEELENGKTASADLFRANMDATKITCVSTGISALISVIQQMAVILFGVILLRIGRIDMGEWIAFFLFSSTIFSRFTTLVQNWQSLKSIQGQAVRVVELAQAPQEQTEAEAKAAPAQKARMSNQPGVEFQNVSFSYGEKTVLDNISFTVPAGSATAIVGLCGSGKTTLLNLLERFYETDQGCITVGGQNIKTLSLGALRGLFSYVQQDAGVFGGTVRQALSYGIGRALSDEELIDAAKSAGAWEWIQKRPGGLDSIISADGASLSGGQRQRLVLAREFLRSADILLLDEPTSALDARTAQAVEQVIFRLFRGKTILMVTHDMSLLPKMDQIVVLQQGKLAGIGSYKELLASCPLLREMVDAQQGEEVKAG